MKFRLARLDFLFQCLRTAENGARVPDELVLPLAYLVRVKVVFSGELEVVELAEQGKDIF